MARIRKPITVCDRPHGGQDVEAAATVELSINGNSAPRKVKQDLCAEHLRELETALGSAFKPVRAKAKAKAGRSRPANSAQRAAIQAFAKKQKLTVAARGRIPAAVTEAWEAAGRPGL